MVYNETKSSKRQGGRGSNGSASTKAVDKRFDTSKPQFRKPKSKDAKIELDDRFKSVLTDPKFQLQTLDKYGRTESAINGIKRDELEDFYTIKSDRENGHDGEEQRRNNADERFKRSDEGVKQTSSKSKETTINGGTNNRKKEKDDDSNADPVSRIAYLNALSRGEVELSSSDDDENGGPMKKGDDDDESDFDDNYDTEIRIEHEQPGVLDPSYIEDITAVVDFTTYASPYLAVMNADWSHFRAVDIFAIISSFVPTGTILRVSVYPSNFGLERLKKEELFGPVNVWKRNDRSKNAETDSEDEYSGEENDINENDNDDGNEFVMNPTEDIDSDFDPEKLRMYEASRLKYYFAVVEFANPLHTDMAYKEVDGMEFEHSSAALDLRIIPVDEIDSVIENRTIRDEATSLPSNYNPPDFVVNALQQSAVQCTWDIGDRNREILLTKYNASGQAWGQASDVDDVNAYLASDQSSDEEGSVRINKKSNRLRSMLGLDSDNDENDGGDEDVNEQFDNSSQSDDEKEYVMEASYVPGKLNSSISVATALDEKQDSELTPWEKYQKKRQQKKREKRAAVRDKRKQVNEERKNSKSKGKGVKKVDDFFIEKLDSDAHEDASAQYVAKDKDDEYGIADEDREGDDLDKRDFDIRGVQRLEKNKDKRLTGVRKRKEERLTGTAGTDFQVDTTDARFKAVLEGNDERFGIDRTDSNFKETPAMKKILSEQTRQRMKRRKLHKDTVKCSTINVSDVTASEVKQTSGSAALSALVSSIKSKVTR